VSTNKGITWSSPTDILVPTDGTDWACAATDGDAYYDSTHNKWHYLFQCMGTDMKWDVCHATRNGSDPKGLFTVDPSPSFLEGQLWDSICDPGDDCPGNTYGEGTLDIFKYDGQFFWVSFHGYDNVKGYRGIAKTQDFLPGHWIVDNPAQGVPNDTIFDYKDTLQWREQWDANGPIGGGHASIVHDQGYYYMVIEGADKNLACMAGQKWDVGLLRSASLTNKNWEQYPAGNPIIYSSTAPESNGQPMPCNASYASLFKDTDGTTYLMHSRDSTDINYHGIYLYKLEQTGNLLRNGDLWMANIPGTLATPYWQAFPIGPTNLVTYRFPNGSSDGNQYLATNCGTNPAPCQPGQSVYQDIDVSSHRGAPFTFGGKFATDAGTGQLTLMIHQLDANYNIVAQSYVPLTAGPLYASFSGSGTIHNNAKYARYQIYLHTSTVTFRADEMYLNVP
jgi:hypothetical protein